MKLHPWGVVQKATAAWWRHQMETFSVSLALCEGNSPVTSEFPLQMLVTLSFDVFFDLYLNKRLSKPWKCWWFEKPSHPLWRHCNACVSPCVSHLFSGWWHDKAFLTLKAWRTGYFIVISQYIPQTKGVFCRRLRRLLSINIWSYPWGTGSSVAVKMAGLAWSTTNVLQLTLLWLYMYSIAT